MRAFSGCFVSVLLGLAAAGAAGASTFYAQKSFSMTPQQCLQLRYAIDETYVASLDQQRIAVSFDTLVDVATSTCAVVLMLEARHADDSAELERFVARNQDRDIMGASIHLHRVMAVVASGEITAGLLGEGSGFAERVVQRPWQLRLASHAQWRVLERSLDRMDTPTAASSLLPRLIGRSEAESLIAGAWSRSNAIRIERNVVYLLDDDTYGEEIRSRTVGVGVACAPLPDCRLSNR